MRRTSDIKADTGFQEEAKSSSYTLREIYRHRRFDSGRIKEREKSRTFTFFVIRSHATVGILASLINLCTS